MKLKTSFKIVITEVICLLFVLLFVYAAVSKLLDFENFKVQIGQSPMLSIYADWISWLVPAIELITAIMLVIPKHRILGLYASLCLMIMFSVYIFIVLNYSYFVPCSCGGILEKMSWNTHLAFNIIFIMLGALAITLQEKFSAKKKNTYNSWRSFKIMATFSLCSAGVIIVLFLASEEAMQHENPFIRRYPNHPATLLNKYNLKFNSYYFAGTENGRIYLGNYTTPLQVLSMNAKLENHRIEKITFDPGKIPFKAVTISVKGSYFYIKDGRVPVIFRGSTHDWKTNKELKGIPFFSQAEPIDSTTIVFRSNNGKNLANILGIFSLDKSPNVEYKSSLLQKQIDGVFDTDGIMLYNEKTNKIVYQYFYRNEFIVADKSGELVYRGHTIDTTTKAKIKVTYLKNQTARKMSAPPFIVNANIALCYNLMFVHSRIRGRYEDEKLWKHASIIDVYDLNKNVYLMSFPIYNIEDQSVESFIVTPTHLYAIIGTELVCYDFKTRLRKEIKNVDLKVD